MQTMGKGSMKGRCSLIQSIVSLVLKVSPTKLQKPSTIRNRLQTYSRGHSIEEGGEELGDDSQDKLLGVLQYIL